MVLQLAELNTALLGAFEKLKTLDYRDIIEFLKNEELRNPKNVALASIASVLLSAAAIQILKKKSESDSRNKYNLDVVPDEVLYNWPILGHSWSFERSAVGFWRQVKDCYAHFKKIKPDALFGVLMFGTKRMVIPLKPEGCEDILHSSTHIRKGIFYEFFYPWLKTGLLTSHGQKWKSRRRIITPAFHKSVLADFVEVMNEKSQVMIEILNAESRAGEVQMLWPITLCALDIIVQTAMGAESNIQLDRENEYAQAIFSMFHTIHIRQKHVQFWPKFIWDKTKYGKMQEKDLKKLLDFTVEVIGKQWDKWQRLRKEYGDDFDEIMFGEKQNRKNRIAFLDTLFQAHERGEIDMPGIAEEVDTFMFEGHDTTAAAMNWAVQEIASHPEVQAKLQEEIDSVFGDSDRPASIQDLDRLEYLEAVIKETLRKFPSVPMFARELDADCPVNKNGQNFVIPKDSLVVFPAGILHKDERHWPDPEKFIPERFLRNAAEKRYAYSYIPFSAGPRNCIGQRFALLTEKIMISSIIRNFHLHALRKTNDIPVIPEIITRPQGGITLVLKPRKAIDSSRISQIPIDKRG